MIKNGITKQLVAITCLGLATAQQPTLHSHDRLTVFTGTCVVAIGAYWLYEALLEEAEEANVKAALDAIENYNYDIQQLASAKPTFYQDFKPFIQKIMLSPQAIVKREALLLTHIRWNLSCKIDGIARENLAPETWANHLAASDISKFIDWLESSYPENNFKKLYMNNQERLDREIDTMKNEIVIHKIKQGLLNKIEGKFRQIPFVELDKLSNREIADSLESSSLPYNDNQAWFDGEISKTRENTRQTLIEERSEFRKICGKIAPVEWSLDDLRKPREFGAALGIFGLMFAFGR